MAAAAPRWRRQLRLPRLARADGFALAGLMALVLFFMRDAVFGGRVFYVRDLHLQWFGQVESFVRAVTSGAWPLWDPYVTFGQPLLANANNQLLYPMTWLNLVMRPWTYYTLFLTSHLLFTAFGLYALGRRLALSPAGAFVAAAVWAASGPLLSLGNLWNHLAAAAWIPWVLLAADVAVDSLRLKHVLLWGAAMAAQILAGSPDVFVMTSLLAGALIAPALAWRAPFQRSNLRMVGSGLVASAFALALAAGQILPALEVASRSDRWNLGAEERTYWSIHPLGMLQVLLPVFWNDVPWKPEYRAALFESREPFLLSLYLGTPALALAAAALAGPRRRARWVFLLVAIAASLVALGRYAPVYDIAIAVLPPLKVLRFPAKGMIIAGFCLAVLAGMGFDAWQPPANALPPRRWRLIVTLPLAGVVLAIGLLALMASFEAETLAPLFFVRQPSEPPFTEILGPFAIKAGLEALAGGVVLVAAFRRGRLTASVAAMLAVLGLAANHRNLNLTGPRDIYTLRPAALEAIKQDDRRRLFVYDYMSAGGRSLRHLERERPYLIAGVRRDSPFQWAEALGLRLYLLPPVGAAYGLYDSFARDALGIQPTPLAELTAYLFYVEGKPSYLRALQMGAVSQVMALHKEGFEDLVHETTLKSAFPEPTQVFRVPNPLPRTYVVGTARAVDGPAAFDTLMDPRFDPTREVILASGAGRRGSPLFVGTSGVVEMKADRVILETEASDQGYVVLVDTYDPGWKATVDGRESPLLRANIAFQAVPVVAGRHRVELLYRPRSVAVGLGISALALLAGCAYAARGLASSRADG